MDGDLIDNKAINLKQKLQKKKDAIQDRHENNKRFGKCNRSH